MRKIISFMHLSVDGFAAGPSREIDWVHIDDEIIEYSSNQINHSDTALYGRITFELMDDYWPGAADKPGASKSDIEYTKWYNHVEKIVLSHTMNDVPGKNTRVINKNVFDEIHKLKQKTGKDIVMFGSPGTTHTLLEKGLVDEFWLFINPVILGKGIPYWQDIKDRIPLKLVSGDVLSSGVVCLHYIIPRAEN